MFEFKIDPETLASARASLDELRVAVEAISAAMIQNLSKFVSALHITLAHVSPRQRAAEKRGYDVPDWVWQVEETMRKTEGSGNGRIMRL